MPLRASFAKDTFSFEEPFYEKRSRRRTKQNRTEQNRKENNDGNSGPLTSLPVDRLNGDRLQRRRSCQKINIHILYYRYLFLKCRQNPPPVESQFSIFQPKIQELWEQDYKIFQDQQKLQQHQAKRPLAKSENGKANKKIRLSATPSLMPKEVEVVTLHSSENEKKNDSDTSLCSITDLLKSDDE